jgi:hypothetical protein
MGPYGHERRPSGRLFVVNEGRRMMQRAEAWFHLLLALSVGTIVIVGITMFGAYWPWPG